MRYVYWFDLVKAPNAIAYRGPMTGAGTSSPGKKNLKKSSNSAINILHYIVFLTISLQAQDLTLTYFQTHLCA